MGLSMSIEPPECVGADLRPHGGGEGANWGPGREMRQGRRIALEATLLSLSLCMCARAAGYVAKMPCRRLASMDGTRARTMLWLLADGGSGSKQNACLEATRIPIDGQGVPPTTLFLSVLLACWLALDG